MKSRTPEVYGVDVDAQTGCAHYYSQIDVIAIKMKCCGLYFACKDCHDALADHMIQTWPTSERDRPAVLCGVCRHELSISDYLSGGQQCPQCRSLFNPNCRNHYHFYFEPPPTDAVNSEEQHGSRSDE